MKEGSKEIVTLIECDFLPDAHIIKGMLESNGVAAAVTDEYNPYGILYSKPRVLVFAHDLERAKMLLEAEDDSASEDE